MIKRAYAEKFKKITPEGAPGLIVSSDIEYRNLRAAVKMLCSEESLAPDNDETFIDLCLKHPQRQPGVHHSRTSVSSQIESLVVTEAEVLKAVRSFPAGSSAGPDGIRPQHVLQLVAYPVQGREVLTTLTSFINLLLMGQCHQAVRPILFGANLLAL